MDWMDFEKMYRSSDWLSDDLKRLLQSTDDEDIINRIYEKCPALVKSGPFTNFGCACEISVSGKKDPRKIWRAAQSRRWVCGAIQPPLKEFRLSERIHRVGKYPLMHTPSLDVYFSDTMNPTFSDALAKSLYQFQKNGIPKYKFDELWNLIKECDKYPWDDYKYELDLQLADAVIAMKDQLIRSVHCNMRHFQSNWPITKLVMYASLGLPYLNEEHLKFATTPLQSFTC